MQRNLKKHCTSKHSQAVGLTMIAILNSLKPVLVIAVGTDVMKENYVTKYTD